MSVKTFGRRQLLRGLGGALVPIPYLPSLAQGVKAAEAGELRFVSVRSIYGQPPQLFYPERPTTQRGPNVFHRSFAQGERISTIVGDSFSPIAHKLSLLRGVDGSFGGHNHSTMLAPSHFESEHDPAPALSTSMDELIARSSIYDAPPAFRLLRLSPGRGGFGYSWFKGQRQPYDEDMPALLNKLFEFKQTDGAGANSALLRSRKAVDLAKPGYDALRIDARTSLEDKQRLSDYLDMLGDLEKKLESLGGASRCEAPSILNQDWNEQYDAGIDLIITALACGMTKVASLSMPAWGRIDGENGSDFHEKSHWEYGKSPETQITGTWGPDYLIAPRGSVQEQTLARLFTFMAQKVGQLMHKMDQVSMPSGQTLLDASIVYWGNEQGGGSAHSEFGYPVVVGGTAGGQFTPGHWDFTHKPHALYANRLDNRQPAGTIPYSTLLVTLLQALGLAESEWEDVNGGPGFGHVKLPQYSFSTYLEEGGSISPEQLYGPFVSDATARRRPVPGWFTPSI